MSKSNFAEASLVQNHLIHNRARPGRDGKDGRISYLSNAAGAAAAASSQTAGRLAEGSATKEGRRTRQLSPVATHYSRSSTPLRVN